MHDWTLVNIAMDWKMGTTVIELLNPQGEKVSINAIDTAGLNVPRHFEWGASVSVNEIRESTNSNDNQVLELEMQSGDIIYLEAKNISLPRKM